MRFGVREICDVTFKALQTGRMGSIDYVKGQPVLYIDSAKTSTIEGAATTVYAQGGKGNARLLAWEGEKTLTFTVEDALLSPIGFAMLSGAGLFNGSADEPAYVHMTAIADVVSGSAVVTLQGKETFAANAPVFVLEYEDGSIGSIVKNVTVTPDIATSEDGETEITFSVASAKSDQVFIDFYVQKDTVATELTIDAENFAGYYYVEASTLFRDEASGEDLPAEIVFPKVKIQSNFTFTMASTGDPSTFTFTMDAFPAYTMFNKKKKALCAIQIIDDTLEGSSNAAVTIAADDTIVSEKDKDSREAVQAS